MKTKEFSRREFVRSAIAAGSVAVSQRAWADKHSLKLSLSVREREQPWRIPDDFLGLSYESSQLVYPSFFCASNHTLVNYFRTLGKGVLRIGGNKSAFTRWSPEGTNKDAEAIGVADPDGGDGATGPFLITPHAIDNLSAFLEATNWKLIYGLNLLGGTAETAAQEAAYVTNMIGPRLLALQIGNEPDLFQHDPGHGAEGRWKYEEFMARWEIFEAAIRAKVPSAPLASPDVSYRSDWVRTFAADAKSKVSLLTSHFYAEGPPTDPSMNIDHLLTEQSKFLSHVAKCAEIATTAGMAYRVSECNSCYHGGKMGVSDTFASALWAGDFIGKSAEAGATGVNLHGGGHGLYTPISGDPKQGFVARPIYYGMLMMRSFAGASLLSVDLSANGANVTAYAAKSESALMIAIFNKDRRPVAIEVTLPREGVDSLSTAEHLRARSIVATSGVKFGGNVVGSNGTWRTRESKPHLKAEAPSIFELEPYSAVLLSFCLRLTSLNGLL